METFFNWLINAPVWIQTPLVLAVMLPLCTGVAVVLCRVARLVLPVDEDERRYVEAGSGTKSASGEELVSAGESVSRKEGHPDEA
ncbi:hypothetical protein GC425_06635 [Corynebacterium sp. zg254]|uniref:Uncharacterized protein n=1 Tax=Corynebacterium zhongnanshanii TaxID=2768834 RepID=A0ABQ6VDM5_9CORY|nr:MULTISPECIES: hypothetical protein [Corynebacterium]KAB3520911.1 hypothetical protein F8377_06655 [Corynebacterium zhongnanshanii]MCR5914540.1 hypothetical protein [Corynebacterium sp. zg254]